jgi:uncharacterized membrane protein YgdD (TMEM256/DUF423 family)
VNSRRTLALAGVLLCLATVCGALSGHLLRARFDAASLTAWDTALRYHFLQALGLLGVGVTLRGLDNRALRSAATLIGAGTVLFCGSLYARALGAPSAVEMLMPFGGLAWIAGGLMFAWGVWRGDGRRQAAGEVH